MLNTIKLRVESGTVCVEVTTRSVYRKVYRSDHH